MGARKAVAVDARMVNRASFMIRFVGSGRCVTIVDLKGCRCVCESSSRVGRSVVIPFHRERYAY